MSNPDMSIRTAGFIRLRPGSTLPAVMMSMDKFLCLHDLTLHPMSDPDDIESIGSISFDGGGEISLSPEFDLSFNLPVRRSATGLGLDHLDLLLDALESLCESFGSIEILDGDKEIDLDEAIDVRFVGTSNEARMLARVHYGLVQAKEWIEPVIGLAAWTEIVTISTRSLPVSATRH